MIRIILLITFLNFSLTSCIEGWTTLPKSWNWKSGTIPMMRGVPDKDDDFSKGFRDGCMSVMYYMGHGLSRLTPVQFDGWKLTTSAKYASGFDWAHEYCTYMYDWDIY